MPAYNYPHYPFQHCPEQDGARPRHPVAIAGGGPVGLTAALQLGAYGIRTIVFEDSDTVSEGSRALCWAKRSLEILDRFGVTDRMVRKGYTWNAGRVFHGDAELYRFDLQPQGRQKHPAFTNLQQYYAEEYMLEAVQRQPLIELRWQSKVVGAREDGDRVTLTIETPEGRYDTEAEYVIAADGARSSVRRALGLDFAGKVFEDHFLIADVDVHAELPNADRRFWFHPSFHPGDTALCHKQGDNQWRVDFQLGWDIDAEQEKRPERALPRIKAMLGDHPMDLSWVSIYTCQSRRLAHLRHGRILFAGDAAHQVSPFGARGGNSGLQDADNLSWKLALVLQGKAPDRLLDSYDVERGYAADENIRITSRTTNFLAPKTPVSRAFRDAVLQLAADFPFARALVNSGRLSTATIHADSPLSSEFNGFDGGVLPGGPCPNLPIAADYASNRPIGFLLDVLGGGFQGLLFAGDEAEVAPATIAALRSLARAPVPVETFVVSQRSGASRQFKGLVDAEGTTAKAFAAQSGSYYLLRPDQHVAARWRNLDPSQLEPALARALGKPAA